ncbi:MAG: L-threonylcarbamoyladenylate synthase, partial [Polyangiales bacterium]
MNTRIAPCNVVTLAQAVTELRRGALVAAAAETVYGLAGRADDATAVAAIFRAKGRPQHDPLIVHVASPLPSLHEAGWIDLNRLTAPARARAAALTAAHWPGPLTLLLPRGPRVQDAVCAGSPLVALRWPGASPLASLITALGIPLAAPSANRFGGISPTHARHVMADLQGRIPLILDSGPCACGVESTLVGLRTDGGLVLRRPGALAWERLSQPGDDAAGQAHTAVAAQVPAPGTLLSHYAPRAPLLLLPAPLGQQHIDALRTLVKQQLGQSAAGLPLLYFSPDAASHTRAAALVGPTAPRHLLSATDDAAAAHALFATLHTLDAPAPPAILAEQFPHAHNLGRTLQ